MSTNIIADVLGATLTEGWTLEGLAERLLDAAASLPEGQELKFEVDDSTDRQTRRLIRPLLAFLANKFDAETGTHVNSYGGQVVFERPGPIWISVEFENRPGRVSLAMRRSNTLPSTNFTRPHALSDAELKLA
jgi:hypothetical protein